MLLCHHLRWGPALPHTAGRVCGCHGIVMCRRSLGPRYWWPAPRAAWASWSPPSSSRYGGEGGCAVHDCMRSVACTHPGSDRPGRGRITGVVACTMCGAPCPTGPSIYAARQPRCPAVQARGWGGQGPVTTHSGILASPRRQLPRPGTGKPSPAGRVVVAGRPSPARRPRQPASRHKRAGSSADMLHAQRPLCAQAGAPLMIRAWVIAPARTQMRTAHHTPPLSLLDLRACSVPGATTRCTPRQSTLVEMHHA